MLKRMSEDLDMASDVTLDDLRAIVSGNEPDLAVRSVIHGMISKWEYESSPDWSQGTEPNTQARRTLIFELLALDPPTRDLIDSIFPIYPWVEQPIRIEGKDPGAATWYTSERRDRQRFYWEAYERYLSEEKHWDEKNIAVLDVTSSDVLSDMVEPHDSPSLGTKGLVVGYVQSGKTANFTGVIAKAIDAGYRLVIVLAGMQNSLRNQTQRRLDKELVGAELLGPTGEYNADNDWPDFIRHGDVPARLGAPNIERLTTSSEDFDSSIGDLSKLRYLKADSSLPFSHPRNLLHHPVKLVVVKKNITPLGNLLSALSQAGETGIPWHEVPSLVVDDESDQASLNTKKPTKSEIRDRTAINERIVTLLKLLGRTQYVGYTATPFANVFTNADDAEDLFPADYLLSLPRPDGYMGVRDFYDSREVRPKPRDPETNYGCYVRPVTGKDEDPGNLQEAIDAFVLSGAIKLCRASKGGRFRHHTMLVHVTTRVADHEVLKKKIVKLFDAAGYGSGGPGFARLRRLWECDHSVICRSDKHSGQHVPTGFDEVRKFIGECISRITESGDCAIILNGTDADETPDFEKSRVWRIVVGGAKLSRGYTVEGLTVSYYRRIAGAADTLMQMGRWFGYREGYRDLVRLYIGTKEPRGKGTIDLYEAFRAVCEDEEEFRSQLKRYSRLEGEERLTPRDVTPLVPSHLLMPSARNKMYNSKIIFMNFGGEMKQSTVASADSGIKRSNERAMKNLIATSARISRGSVQVSVGGDSIEFPAVAGFLDSAGIVAFLSAFRVGSKGEDKGSLALLREFIEGKHGDPEIQKWIFLAPQFVREDKSGPWTVPGLGDFSVRNRARVGESKSRYNVFTEPQHVTAAKVMAGLIQGEASNSFTKALLSPKQAVLLFYPVRSDEEANEVPVMGYSLIFPNNSVPKRIKYGVKVPELAGRITVDAT